MSSYCNEYTYLSVNYLKETILFTLTECKLIEEIHKRFMDDDFALWPKKMQY